MKIQQLLAKHVLKRQGEGTYRQLLPQRPNDLDFSSNDYLNLSKHPLVIQAAKDAADRWGVGATGSRLLSGNCELFSQLEDRLASIKGQESALVFNSGFQANLTILGTLLSPQFYDATPVVFSDRLNHASMHQGCALAGVRQHRYNHLDYGHLETLLQKYGQGAAPLFIVTETAFGMDGDVADLDALIQLSAQYGAFLYVDEAHAMGVMGPHGYGLASAYKGQIPGVMGTFSKGLGGCGAYFACEGWLKEFLINFAPGFIYSTALPPSTLAAVTQAIDLLPSLEKERTHLMELGNYLRTSLQDRGFDCGQSSTHLVPVILGNPAEVMALGEALEETGIRTSAIRPPTVPPHSSRLRIALHTTHTSEDVDRLVGVLKSRK